MPTIERLDIRVISRHPSYHGWPTVARRRNGQLLVAASAGREAHVCPYGQVHLIRSDDNGETWSDPEIVADTPLDDRDAGVLETRSGALLVNWFSSVAWMVTLHRQEVGEVDWLPPETQARWRAERERVVSRVRVRDELGAWLVRSEDGGRTWSERIPTVVSSPHGPIELSDGRLLFAGKRQTPPEQWRDGSAHGTGEVGVAVSTDDGRSWQWLTAVSPMAGHTQEDYHEPHVVETADGRLVMHIRNHGKPYPHETLQCESSDGGRTWSPVHPIGVWGLPSHLMRLRDGRLLMTYGYRRPPYGNQARVSADGGRSWSEPLIVSDDGFCGDLGYPSTVELADGRLLTVWYERLKDHPAAVLRQARWRLR